MYRILDNQSVEQVLQKDTVLLACLRDGSETAAQKHVLQSISADCRKAGAEVMTIMLSGDPESDIGVRTLFSIAGTPTYVLLRQGKEVDRMLGMADEQSLLDFVRHS